MMAAGFFQASFESVPLDEPQRALLVTSFLFISKTDSLRCTRFQSWMIFNLRSFLNCSSNS
jgi:hypothetical protein